MAARAGARAVTGVILEVVAVSVLGYLLVGKEIFVPRHPFFSYLVLSCTVIGGFNILFYRGKTEFGFLALVVTALLAATWFLNRSYDVTFRGLGRFWLIVAVAVAGVGLLRTRRLLTLSYSGTIVWVLLGVVFYVLLMVMDMYVFQMYPAGESAYWRAYLANAARLGSTMGFGVGIGFDLGRLIAPDGHASAAGSGSTSPPSTP